MVGKRYKAQEPVKTIKDLEGNILYKCTEEEWRGAATAQWRKSFPYYPIGPARRPQKHRKPKSRSSRIKAHFSRKKVG